VITANIEIILMVTGLMTAGALALTLLPETMLRVLFGGVTSDSHSLLIARHWGLLIFLVGALLVYAACHAETRAPILIAAIVEKLVFALCVFASSFRRCRTTIAMAVADSAMATVYILYLSGL
jgi:hypothetical protein